MRLFISNSEEKSRGSESGMSLVEIMISIALLSMMAVSTSKILVTNQYAFKALDLKTDLTAIKRMIGQNIDCKASLPPQPSKACKVPQFIDLKTENGRTLVANSGKDGTRIDEWLIRSRCSVKAKRIVVEYKPFRKNIKLNHRLKASKKKPVWRQLFPSNLKICTEHLTPPKPKLPEDEYDRGRLEYYPTGKFMAVGADMKLSIKKVRDGRCNIDFSCQNFLREGNRCRPTSSVSGCSEDFKRTKFNAKNFTIYKKGNSSFVARFSDFTVYEITGRVVR